MNVEYYHESGFKKFFKKAKNKTVALLYDVNTKAYALEMAERLQKHGAQALAVEYPDEELVPTQEKCAYAQALALNAEYVLAVGSGTLNDMAKSVATNLGIESGVLCTAASMDGYCSKGAALMRGGVKVTDEVNAPADILIDLEIVRSAPKSMTAAGFGDIVGKYTCLADWRLAHYVKGERIHKRAFSLMERARKECVDALDGLTRYEEEAIAKLMNALVTAGRAMAICGNSRPASGSEHHQSHFLEMDFVRRGEKIPLHGLKVAIGTLVSLELYHYLYVNKIEFNGNQQVFKMVESLPTVQEIEGMLVKMGCPTRFSQIGVGKQTMVEMLKKAHTVRERYTVLTLVNELGLTEKLTPILMEKYYE